ncbi:MAG: efflux RND transporter periplasmic adaptor subunit [Bryobacteraceae bacterium]
MNILIIMRGALLAAMVVIVSGCGKSAALNIDAKPAMNPMEVRPRQEIASQLKIGEANWQAVHGTLRVAGRVEADETRMARVSSPVTGRIVELEVLEGEHVKRGQVLATVYSVELSSSQSAFLKAWSQRQLAERAVARARQLLAAGVIGEAELQRRESELQQVSADLASCREQLAVLGLSKEAIEKLQSTRVVNSVTHLLATIDGTVLDRKANIGQVVEAVETVFTLADLSNLWLVADVPEQSSGSVEVGKKVEAEIPALPGQLISGRLGFVSATVTPETRTVRVRMNLANPHRKFKPAMLATITLVDGAERRLVIPTGAVVREGNEDHVLVQAAPNTFLLRKVELGEEFGDVRVVVTGLKPGEKLVVDGAFHLNNERKRMLLESSEGA